MASHWSTVGTVEEKHQRNLTDVSITRSRQPPVRRRRRPRRKLIGWWTPTKPSSVFYVLRWIILYLASALGLGLWSITLIHNGRRTTGAGFIRTSLYDAVPILNSQRPLFLRRRILITSLRSRRRRQRGREPHAASSQSRASAPAN